METRGRIYSRQSRALGSGRLWFQGLAAWAFDFATFAKRLSRD